jgi:hypothetical protein
MREFHPDKFAKYSNPIITKAANAISQKINLALDDIHAKNCW